MRKKELSNKEKLLIAIYEMSLEQKGMLKYEDTSVRAFKKYPNDFQLRGYPKYPDTEHTSKRLYDLRRDGFITVRSKFIILTEKGITYAKLLLKTLSGSTKKPSHKLTRDILNEINRIRNTDAFQLYSTGRKDRVVDTDFFAYLGTTVRTERTDFNARLKTVQDIIDKIKRCSEYKLIIELHNYLLQEFGNIIKSKLSIGYPRRGHERKFKDH